MKVWKSLREWKVKPGVGFVPTMGALHVGHASLVERCRRENEIAVVSIFVNPAQFNDASDLKRYPVTLDADLALLERLGVDDVLLPGVREIYPEGYRFRVIAPDVTGIMEGVHRPGFLEGVMTVVMKLLCLVSAERAYFGEKDYQQYRVVSEMAREFFLATEIVPCATVRSATGLAESSRNALLTPTGREKAACIYRALTAGTDVREAIEAEGLTVEYVEEHWGRRFVAAWLEGVRLIDNVKV